MNQQLVVTCIYPHWDNANRISITKPMLNFYGFAKFGKVYIECEFTLIHLATILTNWTYWEKKQKKESSSLSFSSWKTERNVALFPVFLVWSVVRHQHTQQDRPQSRCHPWRSHQGLLVALVQLSEARWCWIIKINDINNINTLTLIIIFTHIIIGRII